MNDGEVALKDISPFKGGCSSKIIGPDGLEEELEAEFHRVRILENKEVAQLEALELSLAKKKNNVANINHKKQKIAGGGHSGGVNSLMAGTNSSNHHMVPISALAVVLIEGEENGVNDATSRQYRVEAERLFNIGLNMGVTTNTDRVSMLERLIDAEKKEDETNENWEDEEVGQ
ncbi:hypothetical protein TSUD_56900 [Trifolium subterraneum]|uniref:Uncharacterized protein n=1 Tax=Trifolium subterraneum TaxID=3900 RepID=A0A2Z6NBA0_TRISU|nr:hypothetical protein TSUD_56900 [Trifolium subterraneum]